MFYFTNGNFVLDFIQIFRLRGDYKNLARDAFCLWAKSLFGIVYVKQQ
jgi:hypothetical protein